ncbi:carboxyl transferase domain-containing protein [Streptomyces enissocaesilis]|uniref:Acetyl-coenzyme A carboxylase carboxyl transferase subunit beta domain-containing protein n=1 Tax=Streptomyces enissocaesilis TaxID=332589 RepID=A0ABN3X532_9ACTN
MRTAAPVRTEGRPAGPIAGDPERPGGATDRDAADRAARLPQLCDAFGPPGVSLRDSSGLMVGPDSERTAAVGHFSRILVTGAPPGVPVVCLIPREAYGDGVTAAGGARSSPPGERRVTGPSHTPPFPRGALDASMPFDSIRTVRETEHHT